MNTEGVLRSIFLKPFTQTMWTKIRDPRYLFVVLLVIDSSYAPVRTEKQTTLFDQSETWGKRQGNEPNNRLDEATFAVDCDNNTLYKIQVDFTSTVVENGLYFLRCGTVCNRKIHFSNFFWPVSISLTLVYKYGILHDPMVLRYQNSVIE